MNSVNSINSINIIDVDSFESGYKAAFRDVCLAEKAGRSNLKVEILFNRDDGTWSGHVWPHNCSYSEEDLKRNGDYRLDLDLNDYGLLQGTLREWENDVRYELEVQA